MRIRILLVLVLAAVLAVVPAATGATKKKHALDATLHMATIGPNGQNGSTFAGELVGKPTGRAGLVARNTVTDSHSSGKAVVYAKRGTLVATLENDIQAQPDGSVRFPGTFKVIRGTGRYKGATGSGTFEGVLPANSSIYEFTLKGKIRY
jgi:hypothetical protein